MILKGSNKIQGFLFRLSLGNLKFYNFFPICNQMQKLIIIW